MGDMLLETQGIPTTPSAGQAIAWADSTSKSFFVINEDGLVIGRADNASVADQTGFASDTYVTNSDIRIPSFGLRVGSMIRWTLTASKTGAGTATPIYQVRIGANRTTADASRASLTGLAQTAVADQARIDVLMTVRSVSATGQIVVAVDLSHQLAATGFANNNSSITLATPATFDNSNLGGQYIGLSINGGASASWTIQQCRVEAKW